MRHHGQPEPETLREERLTEQESRLATRPTRLTPAARSAAPPDDVALELAALHARYRVEALAARRFGQTAFLAAVEPWWAAFQVEEVGRSTEQRPILLVRYGSGPTRVLLWSQMHGDESTATMALADIFRFLAEATDHPVAARIRERLTVLVLPMLNPDGAERFERRNALGIDVNRDARALVTAESRALKRVQERYHPEFGFNLHDQSVRYRVGESDRFAAIALLAPPYDEARGMNAARERAVRIGAVVSRAVDPLVAGHVSRYDDTYNPRAFGDLMQGWGVSTLLVESGGWRDDPEKQHLRHANFVALLRALDAIASGEWAQADPAWYDELPGNGIAVNDLIVRGARIVMPGGAPYAADLAVDYDDPLARTGGRVVDLGDLAGFAARESIDAAGLYLHPLSTPLSPELQPPADFDLRAGTEPHSELVWVVRGGGPRRGEEGR